MKTAPESKEAKAAWQRAYYARNAERAKKRSREWYRDNKRRALDARLLAAYGLPVGQYGAMLKAQGGGCAVCRTKQSSGRSLAVDHCHDTGRVRGLLCDACNIGIGMLQDSPALMTAAGQYLMPVGSDEHLMSIINGAN